MNVVFFGPPGAGKGTIAGMVSQNTGRPHISTGDLFRDAIKKQTELGSQVRKILDGGDLVPDSLTNELVRDRLRHDDTEKGVLLDGFPRTTAQADALAEMIKLDVVLNIQAQDDVLIRRLSGRRVCTCCGNIHHLEFRPPKKEGLCDRCGSELSQREDDTVESIRHRLSVYEEQTESLIAYYRDAGILVDIDGNSDAETVFADVLKVMGAE